MQGARSLPVQKQGSGEFLQILQEKRGRRRSQKAARTKRNSLLEPRTSWQKLILRRVRGIFDERYSG